MKKIDAVAKAKGLLHNRQLAYTQVFASEQGKAVLADLAEFCHANKSSFHADPRLHAVLEGRREVFLRIQHQLQLSNEEVWELYRRKDLGL